VAARVDSKIIESTAGQIAQDLARLGVDPARPITVVIEPDDWLTRPRLETKPRVESADLTDGDIDRLIGDARLEADENAAPITAINAEGEAFRWLADEPELYSDADLVERYRE
jgi:hypothetical protein